MNHTTAEKTERCAYVYTGVEIHPETGSSLDFLKGRGCFASQHAHSYGFGLSHYFVAPTRAPLPADAKPIRLIDDPIATKLANKIAQMFCFTTSERIDDAADLIAASLADSKQAGMEQAAPVIEAARKLVQDWEPYEHISEIDPLELGCFTCSQVPGSDHDEDCDWMNLDMAITVFDMDIRSASITPTKE